MSKPSVSDLHAPRSQHVPTAADNPLRPTAQEGHMKNRTDNRRTATREPPRDDTRG